MISKHFGHTIRANRFNGEWDIAHPRMRRFTMTREQRQRNSLVVGAEDRAVSQFLASMAGAAAMAFYRVIFVDATLDQYIEWYFREISVRGGRRSTTLPIREAAHCNRLECHGCSEVNDGMIYLPLRACDGSDVDCEDSSPRLQLEVIEMLIEQSMATWSHVEPQGMLVILNGFSLDTCTDGIAKLIDTGRVGGWEFAVGHSGEFGNETVPDELTKRLGSVISLDDVFVDKYGDSPSRPELIRG